MSLVEMQTTWSNQTPAPLPSHRPIKTAVNSLTPTLLLCWGMLAVVVFSFALQVHAISTDPVRTFANSFWDLSISGAGIAAGVFGVVWARKFFLEFRALGQDTVRCLDLLITNVKWEIRSIRRDFPAMVVMFLILFSFARLQSVNAGLADSMEWDSFLSFLMIFGIAGAVMYVRVKNFLQPRLADLQAVRRQFDPTT